MRAVFAVGAASTALRLLNGLDMLISFAFVGSWLTPKAIVQLAESAREFWGDSGAFSIWQRLQKGQASEGLTVERWASFVLGDLDDEIRRLKNPTAAALETWLALGAWLRSAGFAHVFNLDVIGDANGSLRNWEAMKLLLGPRAERLVPVWHEGDPIEHLDAYNPNERIVGLGRTEGRAPGPGGRKKTFLFYDEAFNRFPDGKFHLLGNSTRELIEPYPAYSFDATSWERDSIYAQSHGWPWSHVSKETRMRAYIEAISGIHHRPAEPEKQMDLFAPKKKAG